MRRAKNLLKLVPIGMVLLLCVSAWAQDNYNFPPVDELPVVEELPDPWLFYDGSKRAETDEEWERRRAEIKAIIEHYEYGPPFPIDHTTTGKITSTTSKFNGKATLSDVTLSMGPNHSISSTIKLLAPKNKKGPFAIILYTLYSPRDEDLTARFYEDVIDRGFMVASWYVTQFEANGGPPRPGAVRRAYPDIDGCRLRAWSWGASSIITYLSSLDAVDTNKIIMVGNSRRGKTALLTGAYDDRVDITVPSCSGAQGFPIFRFQGKGSESLGRISSRFASWSNDRFKKFANKETLLPFDQHFVGALVAPRALLSIEGRGDNWANQEGAQESMRALQHVYEWFGVKKRVGWHEHKGGHGFFEGDWYTVMDFADMVSSFPREFSCFRGRVIDHGHRPWLWLALQNGAFSWFTLLKQLGEGHAETWRMRLIKVAAEIVVSTRPVLVPLPGSWPFLRRCHVVSAAVNETCAHLAPDTS